MDEKIRTCGIGRSDRGHNVKCDVGLNITVRDISSNVVVHDVGLRGGDFDLSCSSDVGSERNSSGIN